MSEAMRAAVLDAVTGAQRSGSVLIVDQTAERIAAMQAGSGDGMLNLVCRALMDESARRGVAMKFSKQSKGHEAARSELVQ